VADDEQPLSKRERQKQRRASKREAQQAAARRQRIRKTVASGLVALIVIAVIGVAGYLWQRPPAEESAALGGESETAQAAGCDAVAQPPDLGSDHLQVQQPSGLADSAPADIYGHRPATSGPHINAWAATGVYERHVDERLLVHNLEHGYVVAWYSPELGDQQRQALLEWGRSAIEDTPYLIVAQYPEPLPDGGKVGYVAWGHRQLCADFDAKVAGEFLDRFANAEGPEPRAGPHDDSDGLTPGQENVVFPPFEPPSGGEGSGSGDSGSGSQGSGSADSGSQGDASGDASGS
jgi:hypothetical protein